MGVNQGAEDLNIVLTIYVETTSTISLGQDRKLDINAVQTKGGDSYLTAKNHQLTHFGF